MCPNSTQPGRSGSHESIFDALVYEVSAKLEAGETVDMAVVAVEYPDYVDRLRQLLPTLQAVAELARSGSSSYAARQQNDLIKDQEIGTLGDYALIRELGRGGMGVVYEAEQITLGRRVALKILPFVALLHEHQLERFATEATAAARLQHSNIVTVYSVGCERGIHFIAMQLIEGPSLAEVIAELRQEPTAAKERPENTDTEIALKADVLTRDADGGHYRAVARIGREAAEALHYAHENGVLHRDIKPSNLLLDKSGHVWIADFGLARVEDESQLTRTGDILGTLHYMSPEQATGQRDQIDARSDVYGLGATLYELAALRPVFDNADRGEVIKQVVAGNPVPPHKIDSSVPSPLSYVISKAMARRLDERYQSAQELADDLQRFLNGQSVQAKPPTLMRRARAWSRRHRLVTAAIVGLLVVALVIPFSTHHFFQRIPDDSQSKGQDMKVSKTAKVAAAVATVAIVASYVNAKKPPKPPPEPGLTLHYELKGAYRYPFPGEDNGSLAAWGSLLLPQNGKYICAGTHFGDDMTFVHATQWNGDGTVDTSFGTYEGSVLYDFGITVGEERHHNWARNAVIQHHDGMDKIVIVGSYDKWAAPYIARLLPDGSLDETFGIGGVVNNILVGTRAGFTLVTVLSDGSLLAAGVNGTTDPICPLLVKFTPEGDVDSTFGVEGYSAPNLGQNGFIRWGKGLVELPDGRIIAPGSSSDYETSAVFMFDGNGFLDTSFGNGGVAEINIQPNGTEFFNSLVVQPDGKIVAVGATSTGISGSIYGAADDPAERFSIARFNSDGTLDKRKFAKPRGGTQLDLAGGGVAEFTSLELLSDGRILAVGWGCPELDGPAEVYMARFATNGSLDTSFDDDGWVSLRFFSGDGACDVVVLGDHNYVLLAHGTDPIYGLTPYLADIWEE